MDLDEKLLLMFLGVIIGAGVGGIIAFSLTAIFKSLDIIPPLCLGIAIGFALICCIPLP